MAADKTWQPDPWNRPELPGPLDLAALALQYIVGEDNAERSTAFRQWATGEASRRGVRWDYGVSQSYLRRCAASFWKFRRSASLDQVTIPKD